jgi:cell division protein FtsN
MSSMETINDGLQPSPDAIPDPARKAKQVFLGIAATIIIGLGMAGWYLGGRILATHRVQAASIVKPAPSKPAPSTPGVAPSVAKPAPVPVIAEPVATQVTVEPVAIPPRVEKAEISHSSADAEWNTVDPQSGELYLQLAAMGPNSTKEYLKTLDAKGIRTRIAPGPSEHLYRIVIGPYAEKSELEKEQTELEKEGIQFMARRY